MVLFMKMDMVGGQDGEDEEMTTNCKGRDAERFCSSSSRRTRS